MLLTIIQERSKYVVLDENDKDLFSDKDEDNNGTIIINKNENEKEPFKG